MNVSSKKLEALVQHSQKLNQNIVDQLPDEIPKIRRNPRQLYEEIVSISRKSSYDEKVKNKAQSSMAQNGYHLSRLDNAFNSIELKSVFEHSQSQDIDLESYLMNEQRNLLQLSVENIKKEAIDEFFYVYNNYINDEWESAKNDLISFFCQRENFYNYDPAVQNDLMRLDQLASGNIDAINNETTRKLLKYSQIVNYFNDCSLNSKENCNFIYECERAISELNEDGSEKDILKCWQILDALFIKDISTLNLVEQRKILLRNSCKYLEKQYELHIRSKVTQNAAKLKLKSSTSMITWITNYLNVIFPHGVSEKYECTQSGVPLWGLIYYALRCGDTEIATEIAQANSSSQFVVPFISAYAQSRDNNNLSEDLRAQILLEHRKNKTSQDLYKQLVYNVLGRCEPIQKYHIEFWSIEDSLWLFLNMVSVSGEEATTSKQHSPQTLTTIQKQFGMPSHSTKSFNHSGHQLNVDASVSNYNISNSSNRSNFVSSTNNNYPLTLSQFQNNFYNLGLSYFQRPILYFQVLLLTLQFERALATLESSSLYPVDVIHFSLALYQVKALNLPSNFLSAPIDGQENGKWFFNVIKQLKKYVSVFMASNIRSVFDYLLIIQDESIRNLLIKDLILETGDFSELLGHYNSDGARVNGYIERYVTNEQWKEIVQLTAKESEQKGRYDDAVHLYDLSSDRISCIQLISKQLGQVLTINSPENSRIVHIAEKINKKYPDLPFETGMHEIQKIYQSFSLLLNLARFFTLFHQTNYAKALEILKKLQLLPFKNSEIQSKTTTLKFLDNNVKRNFSEILLAAMKCLKKLFFETKKAKSIPEREAYLMSLKKEAKSIEMFIGLIEFQIPGDTLLKLVKIEAKMT